MSMNQEGQNDHSFDVRRSPGGSDRRRGFTGVMGKTEEKRRLTFISCLTAVGRILVGKGWIFAGNGAQSSILVSRSGDSFQRH